MHLANYAKAIKAAAAVSTLFAASSIYAVTGVVNITGNVDEYHSPGAFEDLSFGDKGSIYDQTYSVQLLIPNIEKYVRRDEEGNLSGFTGSIVLSDEMENSPGIALSTSVVSNLEGSWAQIANPGYDPSKPICNAWESGCDLNPFAFWSVDANYGETMGVAVLDFVNGSPTSFSYLVSRDVLATYDPFIDDITLPGFGFEEIAITASGFTLASEIADNGWQNTDGTFVYFDATNSYAAVTAVPWPGSLALFLGGLFTIAARMGLSRKAS